LKVKYQNNEAQDTNKYLKKIAGSNPVEPVQSRRNFLGEKKSTGSKALCPMSQLCGMLKNPVIYVVVGIAGQIDRPFLAHFRPTLTEVSHVDVECVWR
jgi:hypothetical protein